MPGHGFRGNYVEKRNGCEHLSPEASFLVGWNSSDLIRGPFEALSRLPNDGLSSVKSGVVEMFSPCRLSFLWRSHGPSQIYLLPYFILACIRCPSSTCRVNIYKH